MSKALVSRGDLEVSDLFASLPADVLEHCAGRASLVTFERGEVLARQGDAANRLYVLVDGLVEVLLERDRQETVSVDLLGRGDCVGDLALLLSQRRTATVVALRHCRAVAIDAELFAWLLETSAEFAARLARVLGRRLQRTTNRQRIVRPVEHVVLVPMAPHLGTEELANQLAASRSGRFTSVSSLGPSDSLDDEARRSLQDADAIVLVGRGIQAPPQKLVAEIVAFASGCRPVPRMALALLHDSETPTGTLPWLRNLGRGSWHHLRAGRSEDLERLARRLSGRAIGLVLSGGGARGFAHVGILEALERADIPIDYIAGSSMGAVVAALHSTGMDWSSIKAELHRNYVSPRPNDYTLPVVSLQSGGQTNLSLKGMFGDRRVENSPLPFFCVSSNLSTAESVVHDRGRLWHAVRSSISVPGLLPPTRKGTDLLVDGGLLDNLPVDAMLSRFSGHVIAADVSVAVEFQDRGKARRRRFFPGPARMPGIGQILMRTVQLASVRDARNASTPADLYLHPPLDDIGMSDFHRLDEIIARGRDHATQMLQQWNRT